MNKGIKLRQKIHNVLFDIYKSNITIDKAYYKNKVDSFSSRDIAFINTVCLNTMRYLFHCKQIINLYVRKKSKLHENILFYSAITQIVFLDFKDYAVINSTVEISKKFRVYHGFINATLKKIALDKTKLKNKKIDFNKLPIWFRKNTNNLSKKEKDQFLSFFCEEPNLHLVFKNNNYLKNFEEEIFKTSEVSGFLKDKKIIETIPSFKRGNWWVQDYSSSFPLININENIINEPCIDLCAAPGGKSFQVLAQKKKIILNDKNKKRIGLIKSNLNRLRFDAEIINYDLENLKLKNKYKFIILDAPCSSIGTIRKNPEIFFKEKQPDLDNLIKLQKKMLDVAASILEKNGIILYMVCSFFKVETIDQIKNFLKRNNEFTQYDFSLNKNNLYNKDFIKNNFMLTLPNKVSRYNIDGYFAAYLRRKK